jgi:NADH:ubiquinone reductase (H+-translocating)
MITTTKQLGSMNRLRERLSLTGHGSRLPTFLNTSRVNFVQDEVLEVKTDEKKVMLKEGELEYDYLVLALGATAETFGIPGVHEHAFTKWTLNGARQVKDHIDAQFANYNNVEDKHEGLLTFVVAGAGFTGIEFIGELSERIPELCKTMMCLVKK